MESQEYLGKGQLVDRLMSQVKNRDFAINILKDRGDMAASGSLTAKGMERDGMDASERAIDRKSQTDPRELGYDAETNKAVPASKA
jgi:hypothetical protein|tara:strand:+ start:76 stop:333 length:258 start_codon:yes stop_codon:yes gene_type:complete